MNTVPYYIYLDSKIIGAAKQIVTFFTDQVFSRENTVVLIKKYKDKSAKQIAAIFKQQCILYRFVLAKDLDALLEGVIFYPFNAQSNCRAVANRKLIHIFVTHGESNKISSIKPIVRIYDYVLAAGQAGIDRFLAHGIFSQYDVDSGRIISAGNTFVGRTGLSSSGEKCVLYAPTWEGGVERENYSSLEQWRYIAQRLLEQANEHNTNIVLIRPHPNTGFREDKYITYIYMLSQFCRKHNLNVMVFLSNLNLTWWQRLKWKKQGINFVNSLENFQAIFAICDVSAMETQFLNEDIAYELFVNIEKINTLETHKKYYSESKKWNDIYYLFRLANCEEYKNYIINNDLNNTPFSQRIKLLLDKFIIGRVQ